MCVCLAAPVYVKFQQEQTVVYPAAGVYQIPILRLGDLSLNSYVRIVSVNMTTSGIAAIPEVHYR